jgi:hypothetical protein
MEAQHLVDNRLRDDDEVVSLTHRPHITPPPPIAAGT